MKSGGRAELARCIAFYEICGQDKQVDELSVRRLCLLREAGLIDVDGECGPLNLGAKAFVL